MSYAPPYAMLRDVYDIPEDTKEDRKDNEEVPHNNQPQPTPPFYHVEYTPTQLARTSDSQIPTPSLGWCVLFLGLSGLVSIGLL